MMKSEIEIIAKLNESFKLLKVLEAKVERLKKTNVSIDEEDKLDYYNIIINHLTGNITAYKYVLNIE